MFKSFGGLLIYNLSKINRRVLLLLSGMFVIMTVYWVIGFDVSSTIYWDPETESAKELTASIWDCVYSLFSESMLFSTPVFLISMYAAYCSFKNDSFESPAKIRTGSYMQYVHAKLVFVFLFNLVLCVAAFLLTVCIAAVFLDFQLSWNSVSVQFKPYMQFYSVGEFGAITLMTYILVLTCLSCVFGIVVMKLKHHLIGPVAIVVYLLSQYVILAIDPMLKGANILKLFCMNLYLMIGQRKLYTEDLYDFLTVKMGIILPIAVCIGVYGLALLSLKFKLVQEG